MAKAKRWVVEECPGEYLRHLVLDTKVDYERARFAFKADACAYAAKKNREEKYEEFVRLTKRARKSKAYRDEMKRMKAEDAKYYAEEAKRKDGKKK
jgi:hypothetical protein